MRWELQPQAWAAIPRPVTAGRLWTRWRSILLRKGRTTWWFREQHWCAPNGAASRPLKATDELSKQYFEKYGWGRRLKIKEQASVHPLIYICSTWKGTVCYVDKNRQLLRGSVQLMSWAGSVVFVVEPIHRQHGLQQDSFHTECQLMLQKSWHSVWS